jgi:hypothetical protein
MFAQRQAAMGHNSHFISIYGVSHQISLPFAGSGFGTFSSNGIVVFSTQ